MRFVFAILLALVFIAQSIAQEHGGGSDAFELPLQQEWNQRRSDPLRGTFNSPSDYDSPHFGRRSFAEHSNNEFDLNF